MLKLNSRSIRKTAALLIAGVLLVSAFSGCKKDGETSESTAPSDPTGNISSVETQIPTVAPQGEMGTVTADELNVREGVGISYDIVTKLKKDERVEVFETRDLNGVKWGRISQGWICLTYVHMDGDPMEEIPEETVFEITEPITGVVIATELNIRKGPSTNYDVAGAVNKGEKVTVTELQGTWGKTAKGWINTIFVYFEGTMDNKTVNAVVNTDQLNVRSGPSTAYESLKKLNTGDEVVIIKQVIIRDVKWGYIGDGWICMEYVDKQ